MIYVKSSEGSTGYNATALIFEIAQDQRDEKLLGSLVDYFGCGRVVKHYRGSVLYFRVKKFSDNYEKIIPFFHEHKIQGVKYQGFIR